MSPSASDSLTVAVTGPTGTFGYGLVPLLQSEQRVRSIIGIAQQIYARYAAGETTNPAFEHFWYFVTYLESRCRSLAGTA